MAKKQAIGSIIAPAIADAPSVVFLKFQKHHQSPMGLSGERIFTTGGAVCFHPGQGLREVEGFTMVDDLNAEQASGHLQRKLHLGRRHQMGMGMADGIGEALHKSQLGLHP
jgi:hypothetical protein